MSLTMRMLIFLAVLIGLTTAAHAAPNFTGHYEMVGETDRVFSIDVKQTGSKADISFSAAMSDGSGAAPDADGKGELKGDLLTFTFKDSFENEGTGTLKVGKTGFRLNLTVTKTVEPRPLRFYGDIILKKTSDKPQE